MDVSNSHSLSVPGVSLAEKNRLSLSLICGEGRGEGWEGHKEVLEPRRSLWALGNPFHWESLGRSVSGIVSRQPGLLPRMEQLFPGSRD